MISIRERIVPIQGYLITGAAYLVIGVLLGLALGWKLYKPTTIIETTAPEQVLEDLNVVVLQ